MKNRIKYKNKILFKNLSGIVFRASFFMLQINCFCPITVAKLMFTDTLSGNFDGFLGLFETATKTEDVAADVPVTKALINASEHIVDAIFPDTVNAEDYEATVTVQENFTSGDNDVVIAANNMKSINERKADLVPAALDLIREAGMIPYFETDETTEPEEPSTEPEEPTTEPDEPTTEDPEEPVEEELSFFEKIIEFFNKIIEWFMNLFN